MIYKYLLYIHKSRPISNRANSIAKFSNPKMKKQRLLWGELICEFNDGNIFFVYFSLLSVSYTLLKLNRIDIRLKSSNCVLKKTWEDSQRGK